MELILENVSKSYGRRVICGVSYTFLPGKLYVIKGVSGCGKTTLFNIIGGVMEDHGGRVTLGGLDAAEDRKEYRKKVGYIYQKSLLLSGVTVRDNLLLIRNDAAAVSALAEKLGIKELLDRTPDAMSGGERQRAAIARSLLNGPDLLLADEPTSSLDAENSRRTAELLASLKNDGKIVLVATHETCFDALADEILYLDYGVIDRIDVREPRTGSIYGENKKSAPPTERGRRGINLLMFALRRRRASLRLSALLPFALVMFLVMLVSAAESEFEAEYVRFEASKTISDLICTRAPVDSLDEKYRSALRYYYPYYAEDGGTVANYLADRKDSVFSLDGMIKYGSFPEAADEILVSAEYAAKHGGAGIVGKTVRFAGRDFVVSGVTYSVDKDEPGRSAEFLSRYEEDFYYRWYLGDDEGASVIYIPHDTLAEFGKMRPEKENYKGMRQISYPGLFSNAEAVRAFREWLSPSFDESELPPGFKAPTTVINNFDMKVQTLQKSLDAVALVLLAFFYVCFLIFCIFIRMSVSTELYYRRREIGYLRLFGVGEGRVGRMILYEYMCRFAASFVMAAVMFALADAAYAACFGRFLMFNVLHVTSALSGALVFYAATVASSLIPVMRKKIIELTRGNF